MGNALNFSMLPRMPGTPGPGQSVPKRTLSAMSSMRGKYSSSFCGGIPEMSRYMLGWRRTRKNASFIHSGRPPCARITIRSGCRYGSSPASGGPGRVHTWPQANPNCHHGRHWAQRADATGEPSARVSPSSLVDPLPRRHQ